MNDHISGDTWPAKDIRQRRLEECVDGYADLGFDELFLHFVGQEQAAFIDAFGAEVLPQLRTPSGSPGGRTPAEPELAAAAASPASDASA